jgi:hypothetical protein
LHGISFRPTCFRSEGNGHPDGFRSKSQIESPVALIWRLGRIKDALICEQNLYKIDHLLIIPNPETGTALAS